MSVTCAKIKRLFKEHHVPSNRREGVRESEGETERKIDRERQRERERKSGEGERER